MAILTLDLGTTHCKAALVNREGQLVGLAKQALQTTSDGDGAAVLSPDHFWKTVCTVMDEAVAKSRQTVDAIAIGSMAETGLLVDSAGTYHTPLLPWYDQRCSPWVAAIEERGAAQERFLQSGMRPSFKCALTKLLWLRSQGMELKNKIWLSAPDFVVWKLTGRLVTDPTMANRTYAYSMALENWDRSWLGEFELDPSLFAEIRPSGTAAGMVHHQLQRPTGVPAGIPVIIAGHDHVVASVAVGAVHPGSLFNSMGTAEALLGAMEQRALGPADYHSGLSYGPHVLPQRLCWMGGISASGASIEWLRHLLSDDALTYRDVLDLLSQVEPGPSGILYFPYLLGAGAPKPDPQARAAFVGLQRHHGKAHLLKAVLEGTAFELETLRRTAQAVAAIPHDQIRAVGGGTKNPYWLQIKADVCGCTFALPQLEEAVLMGAALVAAVNAGDLDLDDVENLPAQSGMPVVDPDPQRRQAYLKMYKEGYLPLQEPLRSYSCLAAAEKWR